MNQRRFTIAAGILMAALAATDGLRAADLRDASAPIVNGVHSFGFPSVGYLRNGDSVCSGTLIGCSTFLTAAHCVCTDSTTGESVPGSQCQSRPDLINPANKIVWFQHGGPFAVSSVTVHPNYTFSGGSDLAILRLATPVTGIAPSPVNTLSKPPAGTVGLIAGFGTTRRSLGDAGLKRVGTVVTAACNVQGLANANFLCWNFRNPLGSSGANSNTCTGDSGGPLFAQAGNALTVVGVTSAGLNTDCQVPDQSWDSDVFRDRSWIQSTAGGDLGTNSCGGLAAAGAPNTSILGGAFTLAPTSPEVRTSVEVPAGTSLLRVALNGDRTLANDYDLYVRRGSLPTPATFDCKSEVEAALDFCQISNPEPGTWHILGKYFAGPGGPLQLTATLFSPPSATCVRDSDTACLQNGRFEVNVAWQNSSATGTGQVMSFGGQRTENNEAAFYSFQSATNFEMGVKVLGACIPQLGNKYWVFMSGLTDQGWTVTVRDTVTGAIKTYSNPVGKLSVTLADTSAFDC